MGIALFLPPEDKNSNEGATMHTISTASDIFASFGDQFFVADLSKQFSLSVCNKEISSGVRALSVLLRTNEPIPSENELPSNEISLPVLSTYGFCADIGYLLQSKRNIIQKKFFMNGNFRNKNTKRKVYVL